MTVQKPLWRREDTMQDWIQVATYLDRSTAEIARGLLESEGIASFIASDDMAGNRPHMSFGFGIRLMVDASQVEDARQILQSVDSKKSTASLNIEPDYRLRAYRLCIFGLIFPLIPNLFSLYFLYKDHQLMQQKQQRGKSMAVLVIFNCLLIIGYCAILLRF
jgi:hypothetical protein